MSSPDSSAADDHTLGWLNAFVPQLVQWITVASASISHGHYELASCIGVPNAARRSGERIAEQPTPGALLGVNQLDARPGPAARIHRANGIGADARRLLALPVRLQDVMATCAEPPLSVTELADNRGRHSDLRLVPAQGAVRSPAGAAKGHTLAEVTAAAFSIPSRGKQSPRWQLPELR